MNVLDSIKEKLGHTTSREDGLATVRKHASDAFSLWGIPTSKNEEWRYTRIGSLFTKDFKVATRNSLAGNLLNGHELPGHRDANVLVFVNGSYESSLSTIRSKELTVLSLEEAATSEYADVVKTHFNHSAYYLKDGINALNTALMQGGAFVHVKKNDVVQHPVYIYNVINGEDHSLFAQPRMLVYVGQNAKVQIVETYKTFGSLESLINQVCEVIVEQDARVEYYKIQNDHSNANQVSTTHFRQTGKSHVHTVTISLDGGIVRNNLNIIMDAERCEAHLYGLYFQEGSGHIDNHTIVDNVQPNCFSNELYKGIMSGSSTGVFNGKIFVRQDAQKTNAYQSNKNILLSDEASVNTKPQLEIFADDVKCSHGCTVGQLDEEALFYLQSRGIGEDRARSLLVHAFAEDILEHILLKPVQDHVENLISDRLKNGMA